MGTDLEVDSIVACSSYAQADLLREVPGEAAHKSAQPHDQGQRAATKATQVIWPGWGLVLSGNGYVRGIVTFLAPELQTGFYLLFYYGNYRNWQSA